MKLPQDTAVATFIQFIVLSLLNIANGANSIIVTCHKSSSDCSNNIISSLVFFILLVIWFALVWQLGYWAQETRSRKLAFLLICAEGMIALIAYFNAKHHNNFLELATSMIDLVLALWIIYLAVRLWRAGDKRLVARQRRRRPVKPL